MMHTVACHTAVNRMTSSAVAACMAPLLLRPLLAGECEMEDDIDMNGDNSAQLIAAANAANSAHGIVTTLLEEYEGIFDVSFPDAMPEVHCSNDTFNGQCRLVLLLFVLPLTVKPFYHPIYHFYRMNILGVPCHLILEFKTAEVKNLQMMKLWMPKIMGFMMQRMM
jgi:hypothetical protein